MRAWVRALGRPAAALSRPVVRPAVLRRGFSLLSRPPREQRTFFAQGLLAATSLAAGVTYCKAADDEDEKEWPIYTKEEISKHDKLGDVWIVVAGDVYDLTEFVQIHPGGHEKILLAAGSNVEPYWNVYRQHYKDAVQTILQKYKIGEAIAEEWEVPEEASKENNYTKNYGYIRWYLDEQFVLEVKGEGLNASGTGAEISSEPMYMLLNTAISSQWGEYKIIS